MTRPRQSSTRAPPEPPAAPGQARRLPLRSQRLSQTAEGPRHRNLAATRPPPRSSRTAGGRAPTWSRSQIEIHGATAAWCPSSPAGTTSVQVDARSIDEALGRRRDRRSASSTRVAVTNGPGPGRRAARRACRRRRRWRWRAGKPLVRVHHLEGHLVAAFLEPIRRRPSRYLGAGRLGRPHLARTPRRVRRLPRCSATPATTPPARRSTRAPSSSASLSGRRRDRPAREGGRSRRPRFPKAIVTGDGSRLQLLRPQDRAPPPRAQARRAGGEGARRSVRQLPGGHRARAGREGRSAQRAGSSSTGWSSPAAWPRTAGSARR